MKTYFYNMGFLFNVKSFYIIISAKASVALLCDEESVKQYALVQISFQSFILHASYYIFMESGYNEF
jgi:hypothetical protein